jgi:hypothetical protein
MNPAISTFRLCYANRKYLRARPAVLDELGEKRSPDWADSALLGREDAPYWKRDLPTVRKIFRTGMQQASGTLKGTPR